MAPGNTSVLSIFHGLRKDSFVDDMSGSKGNITEYDISMLKRKFSRLNTADILRLCWEMFGSRAAVSSSFQTQSIPLLHLVSRHCPAMPVIFLDTGFHFPETIAFRDRVVKEFNLALIIVKPEPDIRCATALYGKDLHLRDPDACCYLHKVRPMQKAISGLRAWITGIRSDQTPERKKIPIVQSLTPNLLKIHPMLYWTRDDIFAYLRKHCLPVHPLFEKGYRSIGCAPCTRTVVCGDDDRAGRWAWTQKTECGLHTRTPLKRARKILLP